MSSIDIYADVRNAILQEDLTTLDKLQSSLKDDYRAATIISSEQLLTLLYDKETALSRDFSAEIYVPLKDRGCKGKMCTAIRYENNQNIENNITNYSNIVSTEIY